MTEPLDGDTHQDLLQQILDKLDRRLEVLDKLYHIIEVVDELRALRREMKDLRLAVESVQAAIQNR